MDIATRSDLLVLFGGRYGIDAALARGAWRRVVPNAYVRVSDDAGTVALAARARAALRVLPTGAVLADRCLLWLAGVDVLPPGPPPLEFVVPRDAVVPRQSGVVARQAIIPAGDRVLLKGVPSLRPRRAVLDLLRLLPLTEAVVVADAVQHARLCDRAGLQAELPRHAGLRGVRQADLALRLSSALSESPPETRVRVTLVLAGLDPVPQYAVHAPDGRWIARVDLAFPAARLAIEYDGRAVHEEPATFVRDRARQNALVAAGWTVLRFTAQDLHHPESMVAIVTAALRHAA